MAELVERCVVSNVADADLVLHIWARLGQPHDDEIRPSDFGRLFGPHALELFETFRDCRFPADRDQAPTTAAAPVGNLGRCNRCGCVIDDADGISTAAAGKLLGVRPRRVGQLIADHEICAWQPRPKARHQVSRASVVARDAGAGR